VGFSEGNEIRLAAGAVVVDLDPTPDSVERAHPVVSMSSSAPPAEVQSRPARNYSCSNLMLMITSVGALSVFVGIGVCTLVWWIENKDSSGSGVIDRPDAPMTKSIGQSASQL